MLASKFLTASARMSRPLALAAILMPSQASAAPAGTGLSSLGSVDLQHVQPVQWRGRGGYYRAATDTAMAAATAIAAEMAARLRPACIGGLALGAVIAGAAAAPPPPVAYAPAYGGGGDAAIALKYRSSIGTDIRRRLVIRQYASRPIIR